MEAARRFFRPLARLYAALPLRPTFSGAVYLAVSAFVLAATLNSAANLLYVSFGIMVGVLAASLVIPGISLRKLDFQRIIADHGVAGEPTDIEYVITNRSRRWPCFAVRFEEISADLSEAPRGFLFYIPPRGSVRLASHLVARRRGAIALSQIRASSAFPFGFMTRRKTLRRPCSFVVYPRIGMLNRQLALRYRESVESGTMTSSVHGGSDEFYGVREYRAGDNIRAIHWRSTAHRRLLMIREMAANAPPQMIVVLNLRRWRSAASPEAGRAQVERAVELAATLLCYGFMENFAVGLAIAGLDAEGPPAPLMGREARAHMLRRLAMLDPNDVNPDGGVTFPNRLAGRAEWVVVTLHAADPCGDLVAPGSGASRSGGTASAGWGSGGGGHYTTLPLDAPGSASWVRFLSARGTQRLLREQMADAENS